jgi:hypothetical protein
MREGWDTDLWRWDTDIGRRKRIDADIYLKFIFATNAKTEMQ